MKHIVIVTGGQLNIEFAGAYLKTLSYDEVFAVDKGLEYTDRLGLTPSYIIGDFDTVKGDLLERYRERIASGRLDAVIERYPEKKDAADTELAVQKALERGAEYITLLAATGSRLDHVLASLFLLLQADGKGAECRIVDEYNRISLLTRKKQWRMEKEKQYGSFVSVIPISPEVKGLTMIGFLYPLTDKTVYQGSSLTVSNQITEDTAEITVETGRLLVIESRD